MNCVYVIGEIDKGSGIEDTDDSLLNKMSLLGKVVTIKGSSKGVGFEIAREFSERGAIVIVCSRSMDQSRLAPAKINSRMLALEVDIRDKLSIKKFMEYIMNRHQEVDILVNPVYPLDDII